MTKTYKANFKFRIIWKEGVWLLQLWEYLYRPQFEEVAEDRPRGWLHRLLWSPAEERTRGYWDNIAHTHEANREALKEEAKDEVAKRVEYFRKAKLYEGEETIEISATVEV